MIRPRAIWITADPDPRYSHLDNLDGLTDTFTPTPLTKRYEAMIRINDLPEREPVPIPKPVRSAMWAGIAIVAIIVATALFVVVVLGVRA